jgi:hypothetical protein
MLGADVSAAPATVNHQRPYEYRFCGIDQKRREDVWSVLAPMIHETLGHPERVLDPAAGRQFLVIAERHEDR